MEVALNTTREKVLPINGYCYVVATVYYFTVIYEMDQISNGNEGTLNTFPLYFLCGDSVAPIFNVSLKRSYYYFVDFYQFSHSEACITTIIIITTAAKTKKHTFTTNNQYRSRLSTLRRLFYLVSFLPLISSRVLVLVTCIVQSRNALLASNNNYYLFYAVCFFSLFLNLHFFFFLLVGYFHIAHSLAISYIEFLSPLNLSISLSLYVVYFALCRSLQFVTLSIWSKLSLFELFQ